MEICHQSSLAEHIEWLLLCFCLCLKLPFLDKVTDEIPTPFVVFDCRDIFAVRKSGCCFLKISKFCHSNRNRLQLDSCLSPYSRVYTLKCLYLKFDSDSFNAVLARAPYKLFFYTTLYIIFVYFIKLN